MIKRNTKGQFIKGIHPKTEFNIGQKSWNKGLKGYMAGGKSPSWKGGLPKCKICKKQLSRYDAELCYKCWGKINRKENHYNWQGGISFEPYGLEFNNDLKEVIRNRDRRKCQICEKIELENKTRLDCHHIDYNKRNNDPKNLISLCVSCHMKTNFNRNYWTNYFRE